MTCATPTVSVLQYKYAAETGHPMAGWPVSYPLVQWQPQLVPWEPSLKDAHSVFSQSHTLEEQQPTLISFKVQD